MPSAPNDRLFRYYFIFRIPDIARGFAIFLEFRQGNAGGGCAISIPTQGACDRKFETSALERNLRATYHLHFRKNII